MMIEETLVRIREIVLPRIEWFRIWFRLKRIERKKEELFVRLGRMASEPESASYWPNTEKTNPRMTGTVDRIHELEILENRLRDWLEYLEDRELSGVLAHLQEDLARRTVKTQIIAITEGSPYRGFSINDLRKSAAIEGNLPLTAFRGNLSVELGPRLPLGVGDRLVVLTVWKPLREVPPTAPIFEVDGIPDHGGPLFD
jgi:hypothetical protein